MIDRVLQHHASCGFHESNQRCVSSSKAHEVICILFYALHHRLYQYILQTTIQENLNLVFETWFVIKAKSLQRGGENITNFENGDKMHNVCVFWIQVIKRCLWCHGLLRFRVKYVMVFRSMWSNQVNKRCLDWPPQKRGISMHANRPQNRLYIHACSKMELTINHNCVCVFTCLNCMLNIDNYRYGRKLYLELSYLCCSNFVTSMIVAVSLFLETWYTNPMHATINGEIFTHYFLWLLLPWTSSK